MTPEKVINPLSRNSRTSHAGNPFGTSNNATPSGTYALPSPAKASKDDLQSIKSGTKKSLIESDSMTLSQILGDNKGPVKR